MKRLGKVLPRTGDEVKARVATLVVESNNAKKVRDIKTRSVMNTLKEHEVFGTKMMKK